MQPEQNDLEPIYGVLVAAELCAVTKDVFKHFIYMYCADLPVHILNAAQDGQQRVFYRREVVEIRNRMLSRYANKAEIGMRKVNGKMKRVPGTNIRRRFDRPSAKFLLSE